MVLPWDYVLAAIFEPFRPKGFKRFADLSDFIDGFQLNMKDDINCK